MNSFLLVTCMIFLLACACIAHDPIGKTIVVDYKGGADFTTIQSAVNSVPTTNKIWTKILVKEGTYIEKVKIEQPFIVLQGEGSTKTIIQWGESGGNVSEDVTFTLAYTTNFVAAYIGFKNTYNLGAQKNEVKQAPAAAIYGNKASFYHCSFIGVQDTLSDLAGQHYFKNCYIEGAVDFIWGFAPSIYQECILNVKTTLTKGEGFITAQGKKSVEEQSGFVFLSCSIQGEGLVYLGRAYRQYSTVIFKDTSMANIIQPLGWDAWENKGKESSFTYSEVNCNGLGANLSQRVDWMKKDLPPEILNPLIDINVFINRDRWIEQQPQV
ncbi:hypothetical protein Tsubulata_007209 [Turnera subulata]|uniref:pectinesterase n=1 Tax=Turnera subulata TaxID=218843 RepID=A0A9Q0J0E5_9ROSI|nr:hypothetical protein Tsubulata_007209 [Turnera subulata]